MRQSTTYCLIICCLIGSCLAQSTAKTPREVAGMAWLAMTGENPSALQAVELQGSVTAATGPDKRQGTVTLKATSDGRSRINVSADSTQWTEIHNDPSNIHVRISGDTISRIPTQNAMAVTAWFFPAFSPLMQWMDSTLVFAELAANNSSNSFVLSSQVQTASAATNSQKAIGRLSKIEYRIDPTTFFLQSIRYNTHPDNNSAANLAVEVRFSSYQSVSGVQIPFRIQQFVNGNCVLDIVVNSAIINPNLASSDFQAQ